MEFDKTMHFSVEREENTKCKETLKSLFFKTKANYKKCGKLVNTKN